MTLYAYCGMTVPLGDGYTFKEARERFRQCIDRFKRRIGGDVSYQGFKFAELCEPEDCLMVPDDCGVLRIERVEDVIL